MTGDVADVTTPLNEARETNGITSRLMLAYAEREGGREAVEAVLRHAGLDGREAELRDENTWFSFDAKVRLFEALAAVLGDPAATRRAGALSLELNVADGLKLALRALGSPRLVYQQIVRANAKFTTRHAMELVELGGHHARISFRDLTGGDVHRLDCAYNVGLLSCVPALFGRAPARVTHPVCAVDGAEKCLYDITWDPPGGVSLRRRGARRGRRRRGARRRGRCARAAARGGRGRAGARRAARRARAAGPPRRVAAGAERARRPSPALRAGPRVAGGSRLPAAPPGAARPDRAQRRA